MCGQNESQESTIAMDFIIYLPFYRGICTNTLRGLFEKVWVDATPLESCVTSDHGGVTCMVRSELVLSYPTAEMYIGPPPQDYQDIPNDVFVPR